MRVRRRSPRGRRRSAPVLARATPLTFVVTNNTNPGLFATAPAVAANGTLTYTPAAGASGTASLTLVLTDNGGTANGGVNQSAAQVFTITVTAVNDPPTLDAIADPAAILEDAGLQTVNLTGITAGPGESAQPLQVTASSNNTGLIPNPTVTYTSPAATGSLSYTPVANASGTAVITVTVTDGGLDDNLGDARRQRDRRPDLHGHRHRRQRRAGVHRRRDAELHRGHPATAIDGTIVVTDPDDTNLESAAVQISVNYVNGQDILAMPVTALIARQLQSADRHADADRVRHPRGVSERAAQRDLLQQIDHPVVLPRTVAWVVNDGTVSSNIATSTITVTAVNSAPIGVTDAWTTFGNTDLVVDQAGR